jgi:hypothetical protein
MNIPFLVIEFVNVENGSGCACNLHHWLLYHPMLSIVIYHPDGLFKRIVRA